MKKYIVFAALLGLLFTVSGCGNTGESGGEAAPAKATITVNPSSVTITAGAASTTAAQYVAEFTILVKDASGIPLRDVEISIFYPWATPGSWAVQFYDGNPNDGAPAKDSPMSVTTDANGTYKLYFKYWANAGYEYSGPIQVTSGSVYGSATFEVTVSSEE